MAGFNHPREAYWNYLELMHGITFTQIEKKEDKMNVHQVTALEPNEKMDQKLARNILKATANSIPIHYQRPTNRQPKRKSQNNILQEHGRQKKTLQRPR